MIAACIVYLSFSNGRSVCWLRVSVEGHSLWCHHIIKIDNCDHANWFYGWGLFNVVGSLKSTLCFFPISTDRSESSQPAVVNYFHRSLILMCLQTQEIHRKLAISSLCRMSWVSSTTRQETVESWPYSPIKLNTFLRLIKFCCEPFSLLNIFRAKRLLRRIFWNDLLDDISLFFQKDNLKQASNKLLIVFLIISSNIDSPTVLVLPQAITDWRLVSTNRVICIDYQTICSLMDSNQRND